MVAEGVSGPLLPRLTGLLPIPILPDSHFGLGRTFSSRAPDRRADAHVPTRDLAQLFNHGTPTGKQESHSMFKQNKKVKKKAAPGRAAAAKPASGGKGVKRVYYFGPGKTEGR